MVCPGSPFGCAPRQVGRLKGLLSDVLDAPPDVRVEFRNQPNVLGCKDQLAVNPSDASIAVDGLFAGFVLGNEILGV